MLSERSDAEIPLFQEPSSKSIESGKENPDKKPEATYKDPFSDQPEILSLYSEAVNDTQNQLTVLREKIGIPQNDEIPPSLQTEVAALEKVNAPLEEGESSENVEENNEENLKELRIVETKRLLLEERLAKFINELRETSRETLLLYAQAPASETGTLFESKVFTSVSNSTLQELVRIFLNNEETAEQKMAEGDLFENETELNDELFNEANKLTEAETVPDGDDIIEGEFTEIPDQLQIEDQSLRITDQTDTTSNSLNV